jgi:hypothetical protein
VSTAHHRKLSILSIFFVVLERCEYRYIKAQRTRVIKIKISRETLKYSQTKLFGSKKSTKLHMAIKRKALETRAIKKSIFPRKS